MRATAAEADLVRELDALAGGVVPGGVALIVAGDGVPFEHVFGHRALTPAAEAATADTLWDCASLTKPLVTASLCLLLREERHLDFGLPVTEVVPEMVGPTRAPTVGELLLHSAGLPAWEPLYAVAPGGLAERAEWLGTHREEPGGEAVYGCPGYQVLGLVLERVTGRPLSELARERLWPGRDDTFFPPPASFAQGCAPTETGNVFERTLAGERARDYRGFRDELIRGEVHDHNAHTLGGAAGNAGLFATGRGLAHLVQWFLRPDERFSARDLAELSRDLAPPGSSGERRTWGFQCARAANSPAGPGVSDRGFGHSGFTGTSVMVDPDRRAAYVLLTNRVHPRWTDRPFNADRRRFHALAARVAEATIG